MEKKLISSYFFDKWSKKWNIIEKIACNLYHSESSQQIFFVLEKLCWKAIINGVLMNDSLEYLAWKSRWNSFKNEMKFIWDWKENQIFKILTRLKEKHLKTEEKSSKNTRNSYYNKINKNWKKIHLVANGLRYNTDGPSQKITQITVKITL